MSVERLKTQASCFPPALKGPGIRAFIIFFLCLVSYSNTLGSPFVFDDYDYLIQNPVIQDLKYFAEPSLARRLLVPDTLARYTFGTRFVGFFTFALNYRVHGLDAFGYHVVNLAVHVANAFLVYTFLSLTLRTPRISADGQGEARSSGTVPFFSALLFACHPVQTEAVTYISQRFASLAAMWYLLSLVMYVKARGPMNTEDGNRGKAGGRFGASPGAIAYYMVSLACALLAMKTKETAFTLPLMIAIYEFVFFDGRASRRVLLLLPFLLTMLVIPLSIVDLSLPAGDLLSRAAEATRAKTEIPRLSYLFTQVRVIVTYLRLLIFPVNQNFDYEYPLFDAFFDPAVAASFGLLVCVAALGLYFLSSGRERTLRLASYGIFWFFITLSVESSVIPTNDLIYEHRLYLPSAGAFGAAAVCMSVLLDRLSRRFPLWSSSVRFFGVVMVGLLAVLTFARNGLWRDDIRLWEDVIRKSPGKARVYNELGRVYYRKEMLEEAAAAYKKAIALRRDFAWAHNNLGLAYYKMGRFDEALAEIRAAADLNLQVPAVYVNLGALYFKKGLIEEAIVYFTQALSLDPRNASVFYNLGVVYEAKGMAGKAAWYFEQAHQLDPGKY